MIFLNINVVIAIVFLVLHILASINLAYEFKQRYPDLKAPKSNWAGRILSVIKIIIISFIPLYNLALCCVYIFKYEELETKVINKVYLNCIKEKQDDSCRG